jgi:hypothetical protein
MPRGGHVRSKSITADSEDFSELMEVLDGAHRYSGYIASKCPFHDDHRPSFFVYPDWYKCLSCGATGPTSTLLAKLGKVVRIPNPRAISSHRDDNPFTRWMRDKTLKQVLRMGWNTINQNPSMGTYIVRDRGVDEKYRKLLGIGYIENWYTIPLRDRNGIIISAIARKGRDNSATSKYTLPNGTNPELLYVPNWSRVRNARYLILTFGILDAIVLAMLGQPAASTITGKRISKIALAGFRIPILVVPDRHEEAAGLELAHSLGWRGSSVKVCWPSDCKDINDIWMKDRSECRAFVAQVTSQLVTLNS